MDMASLQKKTGSPHNAVLNGDPTVVAVPNN
jgi:hypothetical protein